MVIMMRSGPGGGGGITTRIDRAVGVTWHDGAHLDLPDHKGPTELVQQHLPAATDAAHRPTLDTPRQPAVDLGTAIGQERPR